MTNENSLLWDQVNKTRTETKQALHQKMISVGIKTRTLTMARNAILEFDHHIPSKLLNEIHVPQIHDFPIDSVEKDLLSSQDSYVYRSFYKSSSVCLKLHKYRNYAQHEYRILRYIGCDEGIPYPFGVVTLDETDSDAILTNYVGPYSLQDDVAKHASILKNPSSMLRILYEVGKTLVTLQERDIIFNNMQPSSIVYESCKMPYFVGFTKSTLSSSAIPLSLTTIESCKHYLAPEVIDGKTPTLASDVYSYGLIADKIIFPLYQKGLIGSDVTKAMAKCLNIQPHKRPIRHNFVNVIAVLLKLL